MMEFQHEMKDALHRCRKFVVPSIAAFALLALPAVAQNQSDREQTFASPWQASHALVTAVKANDEAAMLRIFGPDGKTLVSSGDPQEDAQDRQTFLEKYGEAHRLVKEPNGTVTLYIGAENWPFPIPLEATNNRWSFDTDAGKQQILLRRIGKNEMSAIELCQQLVEAENEHFAGAHPGEAGAYAPFFIAQTGEHNGLFHPVEHGQPEIGRLLADAGMQGEGEHTPFHGYFFRMLDKQGPDAPGGAREFMTDGKMTGGFAFVAYPAEYESTGVMSFIVGRDGTVYEKDLGADTTKLAGEMKQFDPDSSWTKTTD